MMINIIAIAIILTILIWDPLAEASRPAEAARSGAAGASTAEAARLIYPCTRACYVCLRLGWGSDGNVYNVLRGLRYVWRPSGASRPLDSRLILMFGTSTNCDHFALQSRGARLFRSTPRTGDCR